MTLEYLAFWLAGGTYMAVTAIIAISSENDEDDFVLLEPRNWIWLPLAGLLLAPLPCALILAILEGLQRAGVLPERWVVPGLFVVWTIGMIYIKIANIVGDRRERRKKGARRPPAYFARFAPSRAGRAADHRGAASETADGPSLLALLVDQRPRPPDAKEATEACQAPGAPESSAVPAGSHHCESPAPSPSFDAWDSGADGGSAPGGGDND